MFVFFLCFIFLFLIPAEIVGEDFAFSDFSRFASRSWSAPADLPHGSVTSFYRDENGLVWAGSAEGLARIGSKSSKIFATNTKPSILNNKINDLSGCNGRVFIATATGVSEIAGPGVSSEPLVKSHAFFDVEALGDCTLFAAGEKGLFLIKNSEISKLQTENASVSALFSDGSTLFAGFSDGSVKSYADGAFSENLCPANRSKIRSGAAKNGRIVAGTEDGAVFQIENGRCSKLFQIPSRDAVNALDFNSKTLAFAADGKLFFAENGIIKPCGEQCRDAGSVAKVKIDGGFLWLAGSHGVTLFYQGKFITYGRESGLFSEKVYALLEDSSGRIWAGTRGGGLFFYENGRFRYLRDRKGDIGRFVGGLFQNADGRIFVGTASGMVSFMPEKPNVFHKMQTDRQGEMEAVGVIFRDRKSRLWAGGGGGAIYMNTEKGWHLLRKFGDDSDFVSAIAEDDAGNLWFAASKGVWKLDENDEFHEINRELAGDMPVSLFPLENGVLAGTMNGGLVLIDKNSRIFHIDSRRGLCSDTVLGIAADDSENFWFSSTKGIFSLPQELVLKAATDENNTVFCDLYGVDDGIRRPEMTGGVQPSVLKRSNGDLWFPTLEGVAVLKKNAADTVKFEADVQEAEQDPEKNQEKNGKSETSSNLKYLVFVFAALVAVAVVILRKKSQAEPQPLRQPAAVSSPDSGEPGIGETSDPISGAAEEDPTPEPLSSAAEGDSAAAEEENSDVFDPETDVTEEKPKYETSRIDDEIAEAYAAEARALMEKEKLYKNPYLTMPQVAKKLKLSANTLSQVLNGHCGQTFYNFVNTYRLEEVISMMRDPENDGKSVLKLSIEAGFNSKSAFNNIFKKQTGMTPAEFRKSIAEQEKKQ